MQQVKRHTACQMPRHPKPFRLIAMIELGEMMVTFQDRRLRH